MEDESGVNKSIESRQPEDYLLSYREIPENLSATYFFSLEKGKKVIYYFGVEHSNDPEDPVFDELRGRWQEFLDKTKGRNCALVVEGGRRPITTTLKLAIQKFGEMGFIGTLAFKSGIPVYSPELDPRDEIRLLQGEFSKDYIAYYYLMRIVPQWHRCNPPVAWHEFVGAYLKKYKGITGFEDLDFSRENIEKVHQNLFGKELDLNDEDFFYNLIDPAKDDNPVSQIASKVAKLRDESVVRLISELWKKKRSVFVVYGSEHAIVQEPALRYLVNGT